MKKLLPLTLIILALFVTSQALAQEGVWETFTRANSGLIGDTVSSIAFDGQGTLWMAAWQGAAKQEESGWTFYNTQAYMPSNDIWDMDYAIGSVWFAHRNGLTGFDGSTWTTYTTENSGLVNAPVFSLAHDWQGNLWMGTARGLGRLTSEKTWSEYKHENTPAIPYNGIQAITTDVNSNLWMSFISTKGLVKFPNGSSANAQFFDQDTIPGFPKGAVYILCLAVDHSGNLWAGTQKNGVVRINASGATIFSRATTSVIKNDTIHTVTVDLCGNVWIGTEKGAAMYDGSTWTAFSTSTGELPNDFVNTIEVDGAGHIWFGTKGGLTVFKPLPKSVGLIMPLMQMTMNADSVLCKWEWACPGITKYWFEIATNEQFAFSTIDTTSPSLVQSATKLATGLENNTTYYWRVRAQNDAGWGPFSDTWIFYVSFPSGVSMGDMMMKDRCELMQNFPNPCSERTTIEFYLSRNEDVTLAIYDVLGRECGVLLQTRMGPGRCSIPVDVSGLPDNGVYLYRLKAGKNVLQRTMHVVQ